MILTKSNFLFMLVDIPSEKLRMYSLNVAPHQRPIFWIWVSEYPTKERALAPPLRNK